MTVRILVGDCRDVLRSLPDESVHCVVTSPPYFGLRDYGTGRWEGGDLSCDHRSATMRPGRNEDHTKLAGSAATNSYQNILAHNSACGLCGAVKIDDQIGLEPSPDEFVAAMVDVFSRTRRVLRSDGTLWLNLGDSYCSTDKWGGGGVVGKQTVADDGSVPSWHVRNRKPTMPGIKPKDLLGIPWMVALALRANGWWLREDIVWAKSAPMPEPVKDRCTRSHEFVFHLSKSERYFHDPEAISEDAVSDHPSGNGYGRDEQISKGGRGQVGGWSDIGGKRNARSVWSLGPEPYRDAHFATMPPTLAERCIKAGCPPHGMVLDPFGGAGTTGLVADRLQRNAILIELNPEYAAMAERRIKSEGGMLTDVRLEQPSNLAATPMPDVDVKVGLSPC